MQILGLPNDLQPASLKFLKAEEEQIVIVGLELKHTAGHKQLAVLFKESAVGQSALFVAALGPGVAEIQINGVKRMRGQPFGEIFGIADDKRKLYLSCGLRRQR